LIAIADPIKESTPQALATLEAAGIRIIMATGDGLTPHARSAAVAPSGGPWRIAPQDKADLSRA